MSASAPEQTGRRIIRRHRQSPPQLDRGQVRCAFRGYAGNRESHPGYWRRLRRESCPGKRSRQVRNCVDFYLKRHPSGLNQRTVREVLEELIKSKQAAGKSDVYIKDLRSRVGHFADAFQMPISSVAGRDIEEYIRTRGHAPRTQNNVRRLVNTLFKFAVRRGYLPRDHDEMSAVDKAAESGGDIEIFTPDELRKLFAIARPEMIPYLAIGAFAGLRAAEIQRLDWSEVNLAKCFIEVKAAKAKTASRRLAPIPENLAQWLAPVAQRFGPVASFERSDKQLFHILAPKAGLPWKRNGLRHSFISYRFKTS